MLDQAACTQGHPVHSALNHRGCRLAIVTGAFAFGALQRRHKVRVGIDTAPKRATLQVQAQGNRKCANAEERQGAA